ncbi:MAG: hypothetical protein HY547_03390 [Elusimicrobia bacterium]|nr:hypothetical protein [Elusimicrobiota bacterium]
MTGNQETECVEAIDDAFWKFVQSLKSGRFFGVAEIHFQDGQIVRVRKQEVYLPKDLLRLNSGE